MGEKLIIIGEVMLSFLAVVGFVYLCFELADHLRYARKRYRLPVSLNSSDYSYEEILKILKAFSCTMNYRSAEFLFDKITIHTCSPEEATHLKNYLGRYAGFADIYEKD